MKHLKDYAEFILNIEKKSLENTEKIRMKELSGLVESNLLNRYAIQITIESTEEKLILEHEQYKEFRKSNDLYYKHPENTQIPVKAHYHVVDSKSKKEIYAVNMDGTAHHKKNKGFAVPSKQAEELKRLGVQFKDGNILENFDIDKEKKYMTFFIIIEGDNE
jgi:hypothetical protein